MRMAELATARPVKPSFGEPISGHDGASSDSDEGFETAEEEEEQQQRRREQGAEPEPEPEPEPEQVPESDAPAPPQVDSRTGLVLTLSASKMPRSRRVWRTPAPIAYEASDVAIRCNHESCRNNPACSAPFDLDCSPNPSADGMPPGGAKKVLLHSCCAPCSGAMFEEMLSKGLEVTIFFYNPNIHPRKEYEIRKEENKRYAAKHGVPFVDCDYDQTSWFERMKGEGRQQAFVGIFNVTFQRRTVTYLTDFTRGLTRTPSGSGYEYDPERGVRCSACFDMRMEVTAAYATEHGFGCFTTTNATSRWKDVQQVNDSGERAARLYNEASGNQRLHFWRYNWQTDDMTRRKYEVGAWRPNTIGL
eukprot:SAG11_NODE_409_length_9707_cov_20.010304_2_plen_361_part_00